MFAVSHLVVKPVLLLADPASIEAQHVIRAIQGVLILRAKVSR